MKMITLLTSTIHKENVLYIEHNHDGYYYIPSYRISHTYDNAMIKQINHHYRLQFVHDYYYDYYKHNDDQWYTSDGKSSMNIRTRLLNECETIFLFLTCRDEFVKWYYVIHNTDLVKDILQYMFWLYQTRLPITLDQFKIV